MTRGLWLGFAAYVVWGLFPIFWKLIAFVPADQIIAHRIIWSFVLLAIVLSVRRTIVGRMPSAPGRRTTALYLAAALLISVNWFMYVWAVNHGFIIETSLGYFINPLVNVLLGVVVLGERLRRIQWVAVGLAAAGVLYLAFVYGDVPWIALGLAVTFGIYALVKKKAPLRSMEGLALETGLLFVPAVAYLLLAGARGTDAFLHADASARLLVMAAGPVTTLPLVLFAAAVQRVPLSAAGILQFISPTLQFLLGVLVYGESFNRQQFVGFALVWVAVVVFVAGELRRS